ncbi:MAG: metallophosphoesterase [Desulfobacterales bacterium]|jgi:3',5'-cyclic AMP phosphodiesterase CpdA|nr:metallophosphoesterase [Desulfobacterales bacterium]
MSLVKCASGAAAFTLIHLSDFHHCRPGTAGPDRFLNKRLFSLLSWRLRRGREHREEHLELLARAVRAEAADMVAVTGDLTQLALPAEFRQARESLSALGPAERVFAVPGNHDALVKVPWREGLGVVSDFMAPDSGGGQGPPTFPTLRVRAPVALIGVATARPTPPFSAAGRVGAAQLRRLADLLTETARERLFRVLLIHHPPLPGMVPRRKALTDAAALCALIRRCGAELVLHGHCHRLSRSQAAGPAAPVPVLGVSSATARSDHPERRAAFRRIRIRRGAHGWETRVQEHLLAGPDA